MFTEEDKIYKGQFKVAAIGENKCTLDSYNRKEFLKIGVITEGFPLYLVYGSLEKIKIAKPCLVLMNPMVPYAWSAEESTLEVKGYFCVFNKSFLNFDPQLSIISDRLFNDLDNPFYYLLEDTLNFLVNLFVRLRTAFFQEYSQKNELFRAYLNLIFHEANQMRSSKEQAIKGFSHIANAFLNLISTQFPIDLPLQPIRLKKPADFANTIAVHINHLNSAVKKATGKSTSVFINEKIYGEARSLLAYTHYSVAEIATALGFEYQTYFNRFFKRHAGIAPLVYRKNFEKYK